jgi:hypothetical protein
MSTTTTGMFEGDGDDDPPADRVERLRRTLERAGGPIDVGELQEVPRAPGFERVVVTITVDQRGRRFTGMGLSHEAALFDGLVRLQSARWRVEGRLGDAQDSLVAPTEWSYEVVDGVGRRSKTVTVRMDRALAEASAASLDASGAAGWVSSEGRSVVDDYLLWGEPPDVIELRLGAPPTTRGGER